MSHASTDTVPTITLVVPIYNEELVIEEFYRRAKRMLESLQPCYAHELLFVDDGSSDASPSLLAELADKDDSVRVLRLSRNFGHQMAITAGIEHARGQAVVLIDGDLQDPPEVVPHMVATWEQGYHVVYGVREHREKESLFKLWTAKLFYRALNALSIVDIPKDTGDFRLIDRQVADALAALPERNRFVRGLIPWVGFRQIGIRYHRDARHAGRTKYSLDKMLSLAFQGITSFSVRPLYISLKAGLAFTIISFVMAVWLVVNKLLYPENTVFGWTSMVVVILFMGGVQLASIGIVGLYIGQIFREVKQRPLYILADEPPRAPKEHAETRPDAHQTDS